MISIRIRLPQIGIHGKNIGCARNDLLGVVMVGKSADRDHLLQLAQIWRDQHS